MQNLSNPSSTFSDAAAPAPRKRPPRGERRIQILQALASMLETPRAERITTAALAERLEVSEAALYRHFASKAQMFEALIDYIESSIFGLLHQIAEREASPRMQAAHMVVALLQFGEKNPGLSRVMVGDALVLEHERLQARMNAFFDKLEGQLRQCLRAEAERGGSAMPTAESQVRASMLTAWSVGRLQRYVRSGFRLSCTNHAQTALGVMLG